MKQSTFIMFKPDAVERDLVTTILQIFEKNGFVIEKNRDVCVDQHLILSHYRDVIDKLKLDYLEGAILKTFVGQCVPVFEVSKDCEDIIHEVRELVGATDPAKASPFSIRGRFGEDHMAQAISEKRMLKNLIHASDSLESAIEEMELWFHHEG